MEITFYHDRETWGSQKRRLRRKLHPGERPRGVMGNSVCGYWDKTFKYLCLLYYNTRHNTHLIINRAWSSDGCRVVATSQFSTTCTCNHLTSFNTLTQSHQYVGKSTFLLVLIIACAVLLTVYNLYHILGGMYKKFKDKEPLLDAGGSAKVMQRVAQFAMTISYGVIFFLVDKDFVFLSAVCFTI